MSENPVKRIALKPVPMTADAMKALEDMGLLKRLVPGGHRARPQPGETVDTVVSAGEGGRGPHALVSVTVATTDPLLAFGTHPEGEEFLFLGRDEWRPLYLFFALCDGGAFRGKLSGRTLSDADFICLRVRYNDPWVSFFSVNPNIPHGECVSVDESGEAPSFYVTESKGLPLDTFDMSGYALAVEPGGVGGGQAIGAGAAG